MNKEAIRLEIKGIVQGIGYRPFIYRLAKRLRLAGAVFNSSSGVVVEIEGKESSIHTFLKKIILDAPPLAKIDKIDFQFQPLNNRTSFEIKESLPEGSFIPIAPDISICKDCLNELFLPTNKRFQYPFINCTNCGPRFTIIKNVPYDREQTTMDKFQMCQDCVSEYIDPDNRRYHAQPNACHICGPEIKLVKNDGSELKGTDPIKETVFLLKKGNIVAIKGLGGFHLACDATNDEVVDRLRARKKREKAKPFAIMLFDVSQVKEYCQVNWKEEELLSSFQRPIVLLKKLKDCQIAKNVAPNNNYLGVMLPYTPLHYLLFQSVIHNPQSAIVMTSGNFSDEPLTKDNDEAIKRLSGIADYFLVHNREIHISCDDSVTSVVAKKESIIRRSRGYAPLPIILKFQLKQILATGAELKNTFCLTRENYAFISQHIGDLKNYETLKYYQESIEHFKRLFRIEPEIIAHDLHPNYLSTKFAQDYSSLIPHIAIQHHHAHIASCMAENGLDEPVIGVAFDGLGYGTDGNIWGGEFMMADYQSFNRMAHLKYIPMPGGDMATKEPYRMAISYLYAIFGRDFMDFGLDFNKRFKKENVEILLKMIDKKINSPLTSSCGRLFDAISSMLGICDKIDYEAQSAMELEMIAADKVKKGYEYEIIPTNEMFVIDPAPLISGIIRDILNNIASNIISAKFHNTLVEIINEVCVILKNKVGINKVVLSGGVFQNRYLIEKIIIKLTNNGFMCYHHSQVPTNDAGISLGQAVIAGNQDRDERRDNRDE